MGHVSVIGVGNMGGAFVTGLASAGHHTVTAVDANPDALAAVESAADETTTDLAATQETDLVVLAVKPGVVDAVLADLELGSEQTLLTFAAGVAREYVAARTDATVVRVMPNLAAETGHMAAAVSGPVTEEIRSVLDAVGEFVEVDESLMDTATAVNGSGPAFVFYLVQAMKQAGIDGGLDPQEAELLAAQTFRGAAETVLRDDRSVDELIDAVCSPNGTTIEGMEVLWDSDVQSEFAAAVDAAGRRSRELAEGFEDE
ncbi:MAG: pyrroline-5-carboxylate reductase [Natronomonas sp.]|jgi:pyrroline-5-carboxylate reductase